MSEIPAPNTYRGRRVGIGAGSPGVSKLKALQFPAVLEPDPNWRDRAACRDVESELFFPIGDTGPTLRQVEQAKAVCQRCSAVDACLTWAVGTGQEFGVWGNTSEAERRAAKRRLQRSAFRG